MTLFTALGVDPDGSYPELKNLELTNLNKNGFTVNLVIKDAGEVSRTAFDRDFIQISLNIEHLLVG